MSEPYSPGLHAGKCTEGIERGIAELRGKAATDLEAALRPRGALSRQVATGAQKQLRGSEPCVSIGVDAQAAGDDASPDERVPVEANSPSTY